MSTYRERPWLSLYDPGVPRDFQPECENGLQMFSQAVARAPHRSLIHYFSHTLATGEVDRLSDALAVGLIELGVGRGDRVAVYLQNVPQFVLAVLATWKVGGIVVPVNPMLRRRELEYILGDSGARLLITLQSLYREVAVDAIGASAVEGVITTSELDFLDGEIPALLAGSQRLSCDGTVDLVDLVQRNRDRRPPPVDLRSQDVALLPYTSGTTGPPKGAMNTHANVAFNSEMARTWFGLGEGDVILGLAPLFHITGFIVQLTLSFTGPFPLVLSYRFDAATTASLIERYRVTYSIGAITAYIALMNTPSIEPRQLASMRFVNSGGAPIAPATVEAFRKRFGLSIRSGYGLTETTAPSHITPTGRESPVDPGTGALAIGIPLSRTMAWVVDEQGGELPVGEVGEIVISGPMVVPGYWQKPDETAAAFREGAMHTGDVGFMDEHGWYYLVDRKKDLIIASGYKVWPREVEDVIYTHPAVREAAVVGVPDEYRGETVKAFVSIKPGTTVSPEAIIEHCRDQLAAYKRPRQVEILDELPKTASGKILRRELRGK